jgi:hypothetical protein
MKKSTPILYIIFVIIMGIIGWQKGWFGNSRPNAGSHGSTAATVQAGEASSAGDYSLDRTNRVVYTRHARCRMGCRHITTGEVEQIIATGTVNKAKSDPGDKPCPSIALEGHTRQGQHLRIVVATCGEELRIVTCIDLERDWPCHCE